jgi:hypothetical protein
MNQTTVPPARRKTRFLKRAILIAGWFLVLIALFRQDDSPGAAAERAAHKERDTMSATSLDLLLRTGLEGTRKEYYDKRVSVRGTVQYVSSEPFYYVELDSKVHAWLGRNNMAKVRLQRSHAQASNRNP